MNNYFSRTVEVDIKTKIIVWMSEPNFGIERYVEGRRLHFSAMISGAERLSNGNILICSGTKGVVFELTNAHELVWHGVREEPNLGSEVRWGIFRVHRYGQGYCPWFSNLPVAAGEYIQFKILEALNEPYHYLHRYPQEGPHRLFWKPMDQDTESG